ncbi:MULTISPECIES: hypothetical protein [Chryseobacterium]|uniref:hypothetical protein n=1 Tax=Chryseobacterium TaxID=59732 RepID=UPI00195603B9|nr:MULTISPECIES: hypothetical protein [Chryseobacterium]MBM7421455.1 hypothetical protein [Chryseobacterium sp. JUb44]MDH6211418.1 hypothetical protein [Chryseobacterium sp. BIGb0186]WSO10069.1 hypothetical protein VUJ64_19825 [Chryseobacterium scophthalmum]
MGIQLNKFFLIILVLFSSCKGDAQENYVVSKKTKQTVTTAGINFFDKKYAAQYTMIVDESTPADHPIKTFLDCTDSYFTIHYIPKTQALEDYWRNQYFKNKDIDKINFETESKIIEKKINESSKDYAIFCYYVPSKFLKSNAGCSSESVYLDDRTNAEIYYYDNQENKWKLIKQKLSNILPRILESKYFKTNFPSYFSQNKNQEESYAEVQSDNKNIIGLWQLNCSINNSGLYISSNKGKLSGTLALSPPAIFIDIILERNIAKESYDIKYLAQDMSPPLASENIIDDKNISKNEKIGELLVKNNNEIELVWYGLYNINMKKRTHLINQFSNSKSNNHVILKKCIEKE